MNIPAQTAFRTDGKDAVIVPDNNNWIKVVTQHVEDLRFGSVSITVHEGRVVQIEVSTKVRFEKAH